MDGKTTSILWECDCKDDFLHSRITPKCPYCSGSQDESPDATFEELMTRACENLAMSDPFVRTAMLKLDSIYEELADRDCKALVSRVALLFVFGSLPPLTAVEWANNIRELSLKNGT